MENRLRIVREKAGMTQGELAKKAMVSRVTISGLESGRMAIAKTDTLIKIADALGKTVTEIFFSTSEQHV